MSDKGRPQRKQAGMLCNVHRKPIISVTGRPYYQKKGIHNLGAKFECADCIARLIPVTS